LDNPLKDIRGPDFELLLRQDPVVLQKLSPASALWKTRVTSADARTGHTTVHYSLPPSSMNGGNVVHGGFLAAVIDETASIACALLAGPSRFGATSSINTVYTNQVRTLDVRVQALVNSRSISAVSLSAELYDANDQPCCSGLVLIRLRGLF
jgi:acyl-coenzyme A thioesterase PaaI-like protein